MNIKRAVVIGLLVVAFGVFVVPIFVPWSELNCRRQEVDTSTGRIRVTRYLLYCKISERIEESVISRVLPPAEVAATRPRWRTVNTFSPGTRNSPHHAYHSAFYQIRMLESIWDEAARSEISGIESFRISSARHVLGLWQIDNSDSLAGQYLYRLADLIDDGDVQRVCDVVSGLQMPVHDVEGRIMTISVFFPDGRPLQRVQGYQGGSGEFIRHGPEYGWDRDGELTLIRRYTEGVLSDYHYDDFASHPEYEAAMKFGRERVVKDPEGR